MESKEKKYTLPELKKKLTEKEKNFVHEYCIDWNASRAAREAGYSKKTATEIGHQNLLKLHIKQYLDFVKHDYEFLCGISKTKQLQELYKVAYSSIAHLHNTWIELKEFELLTNDQKESIESIETKIEQKTVNEELIKVSYVKIKLHSKQSALSEINKMMGYHEPDKINLSTKFVAPSVIVEDEEIANEIDKLRDDK